MEANLSRPQCVKPGSGLFDGSELHVLPEPTSIYRQNNPKVHIPLPFMFKLFWGSYL